MTLFEQQLAQGRLYAKLSTYRRKLAFALEGIALMRACAPHSYLSLSFGKQSIVLAHMLYQRDPQMPMYFLASGESWIIHNYADVIEQFMSRWPINLHIVQTDHVFDGSAKDWTTSRHAGKGDLERMCNRADWDGWYWGLAKEESVKRRMTLSLKQDEQPHPTIFRYADRKYRCCPLANWRLEDLAAYIGTYEIPLLSDYYEHGLQTRTTARITRECAELGGVIQVKQTSITAFNRLCERFPELRART